MALLCPKCHNVMHRYERNGVVVDQCTECKGLFLDRGELERLVQAENGWYGGDGEGREREAAARYESRYERPREPRYDPRYEPRYDPGRERPRYDEDRYRSAKKHKRRSFLEDLFD